MFISPLIEKLLYFVMHFICIIDDLACKSVIALVKSTNLNNQFLLFKANCSAPIIITEYIF